jgi:GR25 family glycosyltransferase involved in LPS biosynthesis
MDFSKIYLNIDERTDKKKNMENLFEKNNITNYTRFSAITPKNFKEISNCDYDISCEVACLISHVYMCKYILDNINTE